MRRRRLERLSNLPLRSQTAPSQTAPTQTTPTKTASQPPIASSSVPNIVYTTEEVQLDTPTTDHVEMHFLQDSQMEVDLVRGGVVKTGSKRTHSGELAGSPHPQVSSAISTPTSDPRGNLTSLISQVFRVSFSVSPNSISDLTTSFVSEGRLRRVQPLYGHTHTHTKAF